jgi:uncharacterized protein YjiS (DUF1127 family)
MKMFMEQITATMDFVYNSVKEARLAQQAYMELSKLNDRELADLGINRSEIIRIAYKLDS